MSKPKVCFVGNLLTLPYSPDHAGVKQGLEELKDEGLISGYVIADPAQHYSMGFDASETIIAEKCDLVIHGMTDSLFNKTPLKVKEALPKAIQVMAMWDYRPKEMQYDGFWNAWSESGKALDLITLSNKGQLEWWKQDFGVETMYWPHGCVVKPVEYDEKYNFDTVFVGDKHNDGPYIARKEFIEKIGTMVPVEWINKGGGDADPDRAQIWKDLGKIYYTAKTALDISHFWSDPGYASGRYFYTAGLGACSISKRFPDCEELFPEGTKIYFDTSEEAVEKIKFYTTHEKERNEVRRRGKEWANKYHNYNRRFKQLFKRLGI